MDREAREGRRLSLGRSEALPEEGDELGALEDLCPPAHPLSSLRTELSNMKHCEFLFSFPRDGWKLERRIRKRPRVLDRIWPEKAQQEGTKRYKTN